VMLAEENSYIVIDEPENHLHLSICNRLWDLLELERQDCKFIYITHNLEFAVSRNQKSFIWNKNYTPPFSWDFEIINDDIDIPEILLLEIIGSRKNVLFCEGDDKNSLDYKIFTRIFPKLNVIPVKGHDEVIKYCTAFNRNTTLSNLTAFGIIDGDVWTTQEIERKRRDKIFVLPFNEIENAICQEEILKSVVTLTYGEQKSVEDFKNEFFKEMNSTKNKIATCYANNRINNRLKHNLFEENKDFSKLKVEIDSFLNSEAIESYYNEMLFKIEKDIDEKNYSSLLTYVNSKKYITNHLGNKYIAKNFESIFINLLSQNQEFYQVIYEYIINPYLIELLIDE